jgi:WD40 repeat protein
MAVWRFRASGRHVASLGFDTGALVGAPLRPSECALMALAASPDGKRIAAANRDGTVLLLDAAGKLLQTQALSAQVTALALARDGLQLAVGSSEPPSLKLYVAGQANPNCSRACWRFQLALRSGLATPSLFPAAPTGTCACGRATPRR